ncbi:MAG: Mic19 family protein [Gemmatimonadota bacterium]|nr:Mic19 family protein [Gemmatimonadota bacterium]
MADEKSSLPAPVPSRQTLLDRQALERVLARAAELQGQGAIPESSDLLSESQLREIGSEVGLSAASLNQALAEERTRINVPEERGLVAQIAGAGFATATRTVPGNPHDVLASIDEWMQREECMQVQRRFADRITWEPQRGLFGKLRRTVNISGRGYYLMDAGQVSATVLPVDGSRVVVRLDADIHASRARRVGIGGVLATMGAAASGILGLGLIVAHIPLIIAAGAAVLPFAGGATAAYRVARSHRSILSSAQLGLEQVLDRLEHGEFERSGGLLGAISPRARLPRR